MEKAGQNDLLFLSKKYRKMDIFANSPYFRLEYNKKIRACQRENDVRFVCCRMHRNLNSDKHCNRNSNRNSRQNNIQICLFAVF